MAPVLAKLVKLLAILSFTAAISIVSHASVWGVLSFTSVRQHGLEAVTHPERVAEASAAAGHAQAVGVKERDAKEEPAAEAAQPTAPEAAAPASGADTALAVVAGTATAVGVGSLCLLPIVLFTAFVTALVRCPRATSATMGGVLWSLGLLALALPWSSFFPQVPWGGLFIGYSTLVTQVAELEAHGGPFALSAILGHVGVPIFAIAVLVGIVWRCGEALHQELLAAESLLVDASLERDAATTAARGDYVRPGRAATGLAAATKAIEEESVVTVDSREDEAPPRRLI